MPLDLSWLRHQTQTETDVVKVRWRGSARSRRRRYAPCGDAPSLSRRGWRAGLRLSHALDVARMGAEAKRRAMRILLQHQRLAHRRCWLRSASVTSMASTRVRDQPKSSMATRPRSLSCSAGSSAAKAARMEANAAPAAGGAGRRGSVGRWRPAAAPADAAGRRRHASGWREDPGAGQADGADAVSGGGHREEQSLLHPVEAVLPGDDPKAAGGGGEGRGGIDLQLRPLTYPAVARPANQAA